MVSEKTQQASTANKSGHEFLLESLQSILLYVMSFKVLQNDKMYYDPATSPVQTHPSPHRSIRESNETYISTVQIALYAQEKNSGDHLCLHIDGENSDLHSAEAQAAKHKRSRQRRVIKKLDPDRSQIGSYWISGRFFRKPAEPRSRQNICDLSSFGHQRSQGYEKNDNIQLHIKLEGKKQAPTRSEDQFAQNIVGNSNM